MRTHKRQDTEEDMTSQSLPQGNDSRPKGTADTSREAGYPRVGENGAGRSMGTTPDASHGSPEKGVPELPGRANTSPAETTAAVSVYQSAEQFLKEQGELIAKRIPCRCKLCNGECDEVASSVKTMTCYRCWYASHEKPFRVARVAMEGE